MPGQPLLHLGMLVRVVVVADQIDLTTRVGLRDRVEKSDELNVRVAREAAAVDLATRDLEGCEQAGRSVALVVVGHPRREYLAQGQDRLGAVEGLDLGLLVDAQDERSFGRIQVQAHDVGQLGIEVRITAALEGLDPLGCRPCFCQMHRRVGKPDLLGQAPCTPMGGGLRGTQRRRNHSALLGCADLLRAPGPRAGLQPRKTCCLPIPLAPQADRGRPDPCRGTRY